MDGTFLIYTKTSLIHLAFIYTVEYELKISLGQHFLDTWDVLAVQISIKISKNRTFPYSLT